MMWASIGTGGEVLGISESEAQAAAIGVSVAPVSDELAAIVKGGGRIVWDGSSLASDLALAKDRKWAAIKAERAQRLLVAPTSMGTFDSDEIGRSNINGQVTAILALGSSAPAQIEWKMHDNSIAVFTAASFVQAGLLVSEHISAVYSASWTIEQQIAAAATVAEVEAITWPAGS